MASKLVVLERLQAETWAFLRKQEDWAPTFKAQPKQWRQLLLSEHRQFQNLKTYFKQLAETRVASYVNWDEYRQRVTLDRNNDVTITIETQQAQAEQYLLINIMFDEIKVGTFQGVMAARETYTKWLGQADINELVRSNALEHTASLAKGLTQTTLNDVRASIEKSISLGENVQQATERLQSVIADPYRANMIARTESVRSYNSGIIAYGKQTGAKTKTWIALPGADEGSDATPCVDNANQDPIGIDEDFDSGDPFPPAHPFCRCGCTIGYEDIAGLQEDIDSA